MNLQQMMIQAQRVKRELDKAINELHSQEFTVTKNGAVTIKMLGDKTVASIEIDEDVAFDKNYTSSVIVGIDTIAEGTIFINRFYDGIIEGRILHRRYRL